MDRFAGFENRAIVGAGHCGVDTGDGKALVKAVVGWWGRADVEKNRAAGAVESVNRDPVRCSGDGRETQPACPTAGTTIIVTGNQCKSANRIACVDCQKGVERTADGVHEHSLAGRRCPVPPKRFAAHIASVVWLSSNR